ncbi:MAG: murein biosynthesis integral membrane protein MurJ [Candidatus Bipolaricaulota bacterium]|nr:murein biosynthesis integral membrane protein MurJ [Candidatus Bipolaricaulota bacterium]
MKRFTRDVFLIALATGISRVFGLFRDVVIANQFGAGEAYDAFLVAFFLPHFLRRLLAEGALSTAFIPVYTDSLVNKNDADRFASNVLSWLGVIFPLLVAAGVLLAPGYLPFLASGFPPDKLGLTLRLAQILFSFIAFVGIAAVFMGILNGHHRFFVPAVAPVMFNLGAIAGVLILADYLGRPIYGLAVGVLLGGAGQLLIQLPALRRIGFRFRFTLIPLHPGVRRMVRLMAPATIALAVAQINLMVDNKLASHLGDGGISSLQYAMRLFQLPLGVFAISIATALLPRFASTAAQRQQERFSHYLRDGISSTVFFLLPAMAGLYVIGNDIIRLFFEHGGFTAADTLRTTHVLSFYTIGILFYGLVYIFTRALYSMGRSMVPVMASSLAVAANIGFDLLLVGRMQEGGLALATSISGIVNAFVLALFLWPRIKPVKALRARLTKILVGSGAAFLIVWGLRVIVGDTSPAIAVFLPLSVTVVFYLIYARACGLWNLLTMSEPDHPG